MTFSSKFSPGDECWFLQPVQDVKVVRGDGPDTLDGYAASVWTRDVIPRKAYVKSVRFESDATFSYTIEAYGHVGKRIKSIFLYGGIPERMLFQSREELADSILHGPFYESLNPYEL